MFESVCRTLKTICIHSKCVRIRNMFRDSGCLRGKGRGNFNQISRNARRKKKKEISKEMRFLVRRNKRNNITDLFTNRVRLELDVKSSIFYLRKILDACFTPS